MFKHKYNKKFRKRWQSKLIVFASQRVIETNIIPEARGVSVVDVGVVDIGVVYVCVVNVDVVLIETIAVESGVVSDVSDRSVSVVLVGSFVLAVSKSERQF